MFARLVELFITIPLIEIFLLFRLYDLTNDAVLTIGIILFTGFVGAWLAKQQGLSTIQKIQASLAANKIPAAELVDGGMILFAAALLLTPGILTDAFGFSLLIPPCRAVYRSLLKKFFPKNIVQVHNSNPFQQNGSNSQYDHDSDVVDGTSKPVNDDNRFLNES